LYPPVIRVWVVIVEYSGENPDIMMLLGVLHMVRMMQREFTKNSLLSNLIRDETGECHNPGGMWQRKFEKLPLVEGRQT